MGTAIECTVQVLPRRHSLVTLREAEVKLPNWGLRGIDSGTKQKQKNAQGKQS